MKTYRGEELLSYVKNKLDLAKVTNPRLIQSKLTSFIDNNDEKVNVCALYGLKRSGKSVMMYKEIEHREAENCLLVRCFKGDEYTKIENEIKSAPEKLIFIDEVTKAKDFLLLSSSLFEDFPEKKIIIAGTDSASLLFADETELNDRENLIHTSYVSFAEYNYLLHKSLEEYIKYGGLLTNGKSPYNEDENDSIDDFVNLSIVTNILHSVKYADEDTPYRRLRDLYLSGELESAINKTIDYRAREFTLNVMMRGTFVKSHTFGSSKDLVKKARNEYTSEEFDIINNWDNKAIVEYIMDKMQFGFSQDIEEKDIRIITNLLKKLDVLQEFGEQIIFTQPGMQYALTDVLLSGIVMTSEYQKLFPGTQKQLLDKIEQDSIGHILENVIKTDLKKCPELTKTEIGFLDNEGNGEFDLYIISPSECPERKAMVYEIKRSFIKDDNQAKHLVNNEFCTDFERLHKCKIVEKSIIYQGPTEITEIKGEQINYVNAQEFLLHLDRILPKLSMEQIKTKKSDIGVKEYDDDDLDDIGIEL